LNRFSILIFGIAVPRYCAASLAETRAPRPEPPTEWFITAAISLRLHDSRFNAADVLRARRASWNTT